MIDVVFLRATRWWGFSLALFVAGCGAGPSALVHDEPVQEDWLEPEPTGVAVSSEGAAEPLDASPASSEAVVAVAAPVHSALVNEPATNRVAPPVVVGETPRAKPASRTKRPRSTAAPAASPVASPPASTASVEGDPLEPPATASHPRAQQPVAPRADEGTLPPAPADPLGSLPGRYHYAGGQAQRGAAAEAVEAVVEQMNLISRGIARRRLLSGIEPPSTVEIEIDAKRVVTIIDGRTYQAELGGRAKRVTGSSGETLKFKARSRRDQLLLEFRGDKGGKKYVMRIDGRGRLQMRVTIFSASLPANVVYPLTYRAG